MSRRIAAVCQGLRGARPQRAMVPVGLRRRERCEVGSASRLGRSHESATPRRDEDPDHTDHRKHGCHDRCGRAVVCVTSQADHLCSAAVAHRVVWGHGVRFTSMHTVTRPSCLTRTGSRPPLASRPATIASASLLVMAMRAASPAPRCAASS